MLPVLEPSRESRVDNAGRISHVVFEVVLGLFCGIAVFTIIVRLTIRIFTRSKLYLDDYLLLFGLACLGAATYLIYSFSRMIFLSDAIRLDPSFSPTFSEVTQLSGSLKIIYSFHATIWTTTFAVKLSFLVFFKKLIERVSKQINIYYWIIVVFTVVSWMFIVGEPFILCPYFGIKTFKCLPETTYVLTLALTIFINILDITTDVLIVSIPIIILRKSKIKLRQKLVLGIFLCLSIAMVVVALTRISAYRLRGVIDLTWQIFWQYMEGCIALIMASLTTFRTAFIIVSSKRNEKKRKGPSYSMHQRLKAKLSRNRSDELEKWANEEGLPTIPGATLTGMRTFIHRKNRPVGGTAEMRFEYDRLEEEHPKGADIDPDRSSLSEARSDVMVVWGN